MSSAQKFYNNLLAQEEAYKLIELTKMKSRVTKYIQQVYKHNFKTQHLTHLCPVHSMHVDSCASNGSERNWVRICESPQ